MQNCFQLRHWQAILEQAGDSEQLVLELCLLFPSYVVGFLSEEVRYHGWIFHLTAGDIMGGFGDGFIELLGL